MPSEWVRPDGQERRIGSVEFAARASSVPTVSGYASVFNVETVILSWFRELVAPEAFNAAVTRDDVRALFNHDPNFVLGRSTAGTLRLSVDAVGLRYEVDPPEAQWARDLVASIKRRDVTQSSFQFQVTREEWVEPVNPAQLPLRIIREVKLFDVSPVTFPAYEQTSVGARERAAALVEARGLRDLASASSPARFSDARRRVRLLGSL